MLWLVMGLLALLLICLTPSFGYVTVPLAGFLIFLVLKHTSQSAQVLAAYVIILRDGTSIPGQVWFALWLAGTAAAVVIGARWMLRPAVHPPVPSG